MATKEKLQEQCDLILEHFSKYAVLPEAPAHANKSNDELLEMLANQVITLEGFKAIQTYKASQDSMPIDEHAKLLDGLVALFVVKQRGGELKGKDIMNKAIIDKLGLPWRKVDAAVAITKYIKNNLKLHPLSFRSTFKTADEIFQKMVDHEKGQDKLLKVISKYYAEANELTKARAAAAKKK